jgi:hypothetical protein
MMQVHQDWVRAGSRVCLVWDLRDWPAMICLVPKNHAGASFFGLGVPGVGWFRWLMCDSMHFCSFKRPGNRSIFPRGMGGRYSGIIIEVTVH